MRPLSCRFFIDRTQSQSSLISASTTKISPLPKLNTETNTMANVKSRLPLKEQSGKYHLNSSVSGVFSYGYVALTRLRSTIGCRRERTDSELVDMSIGQVMLNSLIYQQTLPFRQTTQILSILSHTITCQHLFNFYLKNQFFLDKNIRGRILFKNVSGSTKHFHFK